MYFVNAHLHFILSEEYCHKIHAFVGICSLMWISQTLPMAGYWIRPSNKVVLAIDQEIIVDSGYAEIKIFEADSRNDAPSMLRPTTSNFFYQHEGL